MKVIKKIDIFVLKEYALLFVGTFFICLFIFLMQFMWRYVDELIGKGLTMDILARFFYYSSLTLIPMSLPLAILLASLITFGNLGERLELLSMKAAGIPLVRILCPVMTFNFLLCFGSFYFQNVTAPRAQKKLYTLIYSMKQKSPELEIPEGIFYSEIPGYNIFVEEKNKQTGMLYGVMIYSTTDGYEDAQIVLSDSAEMHSTADEKHLELTMYNGERFRNMQAQSNMMRKANIPYMRETFIREIDLIPFDNDFNMLDANTFSGSAQTKNLKEIEAGIDSLDRRRDSIGHALFDYLKNTSYKRKQNIKPNDSVRIATQKVVFDTLFTHYTANQQRDILRNAIQKNATANNEYEFRSLVSADLDRTLRVHQIEWHKKFTLSLACLFFFFIGAPLGAIIRKGGLGIPVVVSVTIFIFYYIINVSGEKMARSGEIAPWFGEWLSSMVLCPVGIFLTYKANKDSAVFNMEAYIKVLRKLLGLRLSRNITRKEVIINDPNYTTIKPQLLTLANDWDIYARKNRLRRPPSYVHIFFHNEADNEVQTLSNKMDRIIDELSNSKNNIILDALNKLPIVSTQAHTRPFANGKWNMTLGIIFPVGLFFYFRIWFYRLRLYNDIRQIRKYTTFIATQIDKILTNE